MTQQQTLIGPRAGAFSFTAGCIGAALFALGTLLVNRDLKELDFVVVLTLIAVGVLTWYRMTSGRAAVIGGLVFGALFTLEQALFVSSDLTESGTSLATTLVDTFGLAAGLLIVAGAVAGLVGSRNGSVRA